MPFNPKEKGSKEKPALPAASNNAQPKEGKSFKMFLSLATGAIGKWQKTLTEERRLKIRKLFTVPRNDPCDPFKPNSEVQVKVISEQPLKQELPQEEKNLLQTIAVNYDYCMPLDIIEWQYPNLDIPNENREQLDKLPTWLKALIVRRYEKIHEYFGSRTLYFLRMLANRIDFQRNIPMKIFEMDENEDEEDVYTINKNFVITDFELDSGPIVEAKKPARSLHGQDLFRVAHAIVLWRLPKTARAEWAPNVVHRSACTLRQAMLTRATPAETAMAGEEEGFNLGSDDESAEESLYKPLSWQEIISERPEFKENVQEKIEKDFSQAPKEFQKYNEDVAPRIKRKREQRRKKEEERKQQMKELKAQQKWWERTKIYAARKARQSKRDELINRGLYRRYSRIWYKNCPKEEIAPTKKRAHHYRFDEGFHAYIVALVNSSLFKGLIIIVIIINAFVLAVETGEVDDDSSYVNLFEVLDNFFLSVYLTVYAHPQKYWRSGFNIFDFLILVVSLVKTFIDWLSLAEVNYLRPLVIVRALRILRGVSINIQMQVLVTALVETLKTHVLSVLILLLLLMYISAIIAYYLFSENLPSQWSNLGKVKLHSLNDALKILQKAGNAKISLRMLNLFAFVTMDGWTDMLDDFTELGGLWIHYGRCFCLVGIVLGNFVFSNIFIAIIIMQISEATEAFRNKQKDEREAVVKRKKETVFKRQKLDMRQLLAKQKMSMSVDFFYLANQFQKLLRHDDLVDMRETVFSPMWIDALHKCSQRCIHTSNMIMNIHRQVADQLLAIFELYSTNKPDIKPIRRARYNRCVRLKAKLAVLKNEFYRAAVTKSEKVAEKAFRTLIVKLPSDTDIEGGGGGDSISVKKSGGDN